MATSIRIERRVMAEATYVCSVEVPEDASAIEGAIALRSLGAIADIVAVGRCPGCLAPTGVVHNPECPLALPDLIARAREHEL